MSPLLVFIPACFLLGCATVAVPWLTFTMTGQSADVHASQGYASGSSESNGSLNYFFSTSAIFLSSSYEAMDEVARNDKVLVHGTNHMGAGDVYAGKVYGVIEQWNDCHSSHAPIEIAVFDGQTLQLEKTVDISKDIPEASGIAIDPDSGEAVVTSYCDASNLYAFDLSTLKPVRKIPLALPVPEIQGATYRDGFLYIARTNGELYGLRLRDGAIRLLYRSPKRGEYEGLDFHTDQLRWLVNQLDGRHILYSYTPGAD